MILLVISLQVVVTLKKQLIVFGNLYKSQLLISHTTDMNGGMSPKTKA